MRILTALPGDRRGRPESHDYGMLFDGRVRLLENGVDFTNTPQAKRAALYTAAKRYGVRLSTRVTPKGDLAIQAR